MEVYETDNELVGYPTPLDCSLDVQTLLGYFGRRAKMYCKSSANKYLFSYDKDFLSVVPSRGKTYRLIGRSECLKPVDSTINYDVYYVGSLLDCGNKFNEYCMEVLRCRVLLLF